MDLYHIIIDDLYENHITSLFKNILVMSKHTKNTQHCELFGGGHYHIVGIPKFRKRLLRDIGQERFNEEGVTGGKLFKQYLAEQAKWIYLRTPGHRRNAVKYALDKDEIIIHHQDLIDAMQNDHPNSGQIDDCIRACEDQVLSKEEYDQWRERFPTQKAWQHEILKKRLHKSTFGKYYKIEQKAKNYEKSIPLTPEMKNDINAIEIDCKLISNLKYFINMLDPYESFGLVLILFGEARSFKSTVCKILGEYYGGATTMPGSQFIQPDTLKWDSHIKSGNENLIIEEMRWKDIGKKITIKDTLHKLKEEFTGGEQNKRIAKTSEMSDIPMKLRYLFLTSNTYDHEGISCSNINFLIEEDDSLKRRIKCIQKKSRSEHVWTNMCHKYGYEKLCGIISKFLKDETYGFMDLNKIDLEGILGEAGIKTQPKSLVSADYDSDSDNESTASTDDGLIYSMDHQQFVRESKLKSNYTSFKTDGEWQIE